MHPTEGDTFKNQQELAIGYDGSLAICITGLELISTLLEPFIVNREAVLLPRKDLHTCLALIEEYKHVSRQKVLMKFIRHNPAKAVERFEHIHIALIDEVPDGRT